MTVDFALFLSPEGIALAHRQAAGHWALVGEAALDGDLAAAMADLKATAAARGCADGRVLLILPDDQVLYTSFMAPAGDPALAEARIVEGLEGMTPYDVSDLTYDWRAVEEDRIKVAVVATETLQEAEAFASGHGFASAGFAATPPAERFPGMPLFGADRPDLPDTATGMAFGADAWTDPAAAAAGAEDAKETGEEAKTPAEAEDAAEQPADTPEPEAAAAPEPDTATPGPTAAAPAEDATESAAPEPQGDDAAPGEAVAAPEPADDPGPPRQAGPSAETDADPPEAEEAAPRPVTDPTLDRPIAPLEDETSDAAATGPTEAPEAPVPNADETDTDTDTDTAASGKPSSGRKRAGSAKPLTAEKAAAPRPQRAGRITPVPVAADPDAASPEAEGADEPLPSLGFGARRGRAPKPEAGQIVSTRPARLGFGQGGGAPRGETPVLHPDADPVTASSTPAGPAAEGSQPTGNRLAAQLARVREASKARPRAAPELSAPAMPPAARSASADDAMAARAETPSSGAAPAASGPAGLFRRRKTGTATASAGAAGGGAATADQTFTSGLLARKPVEQAGPSFRTGLILTLVLLLLLALIAVWSVLFLPDSPMARLFSGTDRDAAALSEDPLDAPPPPAAVSVPPAMGLADPGPDRGAGPDSAADGGPDATEMAALAPDPDIAPPLSEPAPDETVAAEPATAEAPLPDIDADLDLPPLPPLPEDALPSLEETQAIYDADGIWPRPPERPSFAPFTVTDDIYVAAIDPAVSAFDAIALPPPGVNPAEVLRRVPPPPPFGAEIERDARGLVAPTPEGVLTPEGAFVVLGTPPVAAVPRPQDAAPPPEVAPAIDVEDAILGTFQPVPRPGDLEETRQRQVLGGLTVTELAAMRPDPRPLSAQEAAAAASLFPGDGDAAEAAGPAAPATEIRGTALAVARSLLPANRPGNIEAIVAAAERAPARAVEVAAVAAPPSIPSNADVSRAATERNAIRLRDVNLIGVTGTPSNRRALVRLPSGRFVRVGVGDRLDGGRVAAIGESTLQYVRNGRNITLEIPG